MREIVMGLYWSPPGATDAMDTADLDALCVLLDPDDAIIDVVSPSHPRTATDSAVHTGDSQDGSSQWDDERIFVFLDTLPPEVTRLVFCVSSPSGHPLSQVPGARCHISDSRQERILSNADLQSGGNETFLPVFRLCRKNDDWRFETPDPKSGPALRTAIEGWHRVSRNEQTTRAT